MKTKKKDMKPLNKISTPIIITWLVLIGIIIYFWMKTNSYITHNDLSTQVAVTFYTNSPEETDSNAIETASGFRLSENTLFSLEFSRAYSSFGVIAISRDLLDTYPYGSIIVIEDKKLNSIYGKYFVVLDTLNKRFTNAVDILVNDTMLFQEEIGRYENVKIFKLE